MHHIGEVWIQTAHDVPLTRQWTQTLARLVRLSIGNQARLTMTVAQVAQSLFDYCRDVKVSFDVHENQGLFWLQVTISEQIHELPHTDADPPTLSRSDLLKWLDGLKMFVRDYTISAEDNRPIQVITAKPFPPWNKSVDPREIATWIEELAHQGPQSPVEVILDQNQALLQVLDQLREKEKALETALAAKEALEEVRDDLIHALVHDLRNPLASIRSSLSGILYNSPDNLDVYQQAMIEISYEGARKMSRLVENILDVHKLEREELKIQPTKFSLKDLIGQVVQLQMSLAAEKELQINLAIPEDLPEIEADKALVERLLQNLLDNAIKFSTAGGDVGITVREIRPQRLRTERSDRFSGYFIRITDSGPGISQETRKKLFAKFATGGNDKRGTGIGLAFCKLVVQAHGGNIWVENNPGGGAVFAFTLPVSISTGELEHA